MTERRCAWCGVEKWRDNERAGLVPIETSHGICDECFEKTKATLRRVASLRPAASKEATEVDPAPSCGCGES